MTAELGGVGGGEFRAWIDNRIDNLKVNKRDVLAALRDLNLPIVTTNYDTLIEQITGFPSVTWLFDVTRELRKRRGSAGDDGRTPPIAPLLMIRRQVRGAILRLPTQEGLEKW